MYAMLCTRPDVCLAINLAGRYQSNPGVDHLTVVKSILKYLKRTKDMFLIYGGLKELIVSGYVYASFDTDPDDSKSQTGYVFIFNGGAISWCSSKQIDVAGSTCEAEYIAASEAANEGIRITKKDQTHQEMLQLHPRFGLGGRHRDLQNTYRSECGRPID